MKRLFLLLVTLMGTVANAQPQAKYGPQAVPLSHNSGYFRKARGADFWALIPYYAGQFNEKSCSIAAAVMVINAARISAPLTSDDKLVTQEELLRRLPKKWSEAVGPKGRGVSLGELKDLLLEGLEVYGIYGATVEAVSVTDASAETMDRIRKILSENEKTSRDFVVANFIQGAYTGDASVGHIAPVGAYDARTRRVLILDPDREWYEPYWVSDDTFLAGLAPQDPISGKSRGLVWVKLGSLYKNK